MYILNKYFYFKYIFFKLYIFIIVQKRFNISLSVHLYFKFIFSALLFPILIFCFVMLQDLLNYTVIGRCQHVLSLCFIEKPSSASLFSVMSDIFWGVDALNYNKMIISNHFNTNLKLRKVILISCNFKWHAFLLSSILIYEYSYNIHIC